MQLRFNATIEQMARNGYKPALRSIQLGIQSNEPKSEIEVRRFLRDNRDGILKQLCQSYRLSEDIEIARTIDAFVIQTHIHGGRQVIVETGNNIIQY